MAGPNLSLTPSSRTVSQHASDHAAVHGIVNAFDTGIGAANSGQSPVFNGAVYVPTTGPVFNVQTFGALGTWNGSSGADDTSAIASTVTAAQALASAFTIYFPPLPSGRYYKCTSLPLAVGARYVGGSQTASIIYCTSGSLISVGSGSYYNMSFADLQFLTAGSHIIDLGTGNFYKNTFSRCYFYSGVAASSWIHQNSGGNFNENVFEECTWDRLSTATVPGVDVINSNGACNDNEWRDCLAYGHNVTNVGAPAFRIEGTSSSTYLYNNRFISITGEQNTAGLIHAYTVNGLAIEDCTDEDATSNYADHVIKVSTSSSSTLASHNISIKRSGRLGGTLGASIYDIWMPTTTSSPPRPTNVTIELPEVYPSSPTMQLPGWRTVIIGDNGSDGSVISVATSDTIRTGRDTTGNRPAASGVGIGAMFYDTTLHLPIFSDGTNWRNAAGTVV